MGIILPKLFKELRVVGQRRDEIQDSVDHDSIQASQKIGASLTQRRFECEHKELTHVAPSNLLSYFLPLQSHL
ncbi:hypothetical protein PsYK624_096340 [Phanerochaete sordida]|uniref:Uncharacterized protein n=1 Tax=Phanerochaete sordida TaxID=48140 RepID=A0A9P3LFN8_9APHY|nr:hypothetical protein PsYK624_096340 [Phanerochaete sordida]